MVCAASTTTAIRAIKSTASLLFDCGAGSIRIPFLAGLKVISLLSAYCLLPHSAALPFAAMLDVDLQAFDLLVKG